jgi:hypothetical protein
MKVLRVLALIIGCAFLFLLLVGFDNLLDLLRSRVMLALTIGPLVALFIWSVYRIFRPRKHSSGEIIDVTPPKS